MSETIDHGGRFFTPSLSSDESSNKAGNTSTESNSSGFSFSWDNYCPRLSYANISSSGSDDSRRSSDWPYNEWNTSTGNSSTPIPVGENGRDDSSRHTSTRSAYSFPGDSKLIDLCNNYGSFFTGLNRPNNESSNDDVNDENHFGQVPLSRSGIRGDRANNSNLHQANGSSAGLGLGESSSFGSFLGPRSSLNSSSNPCGSTEKLPPSPTNSDSGIGLSAIASDNYVSSLMSSLNLGTFGSSCRTSQSSQLIQPLQNNNSINNSLNTPPSKPPRMSNTASILAAMQSPSSLFLPPFSPALNRTSSYPDSYMLSSISGDKRWMSSKYNSHRDYLEKALELQRTAASYCEAPVKWSGSLQLTEIKNPTYSTKVFLGGTPYDLADEELIQFFSQFGRVEVEWPKENIKTKQKKKGYNYMIFESERCVKALLAQCEVRRGKYYIRLPSRRMPDKDVQVIPWALCNSNYTKDTNFRVEFSKTVFVGNLHGMMTAEALAKIMDELFGNVIYAGIDVDTKKYPIGSSRIAFSDANSHKKAVETAFIDVEMGRVTKRVCPNSSPMPPKQLTFSSCFSSK